MDRQDAGPTAGPFVGGLWYLLLMDGKMPVLLPVLSELVSILILLHAGTLLAP
jgi:hypothetical protein